MPKTMLIDATRQEETRVVVADGSRLEEYDVAVASHKQIKGNVYLAKVVRVEPSLQSAFVDYGDDRHGFLSFNEIHPDYFQIPVADREAIIAEDTKLARTEAEDEDDQDDLEAPDDPPRDGDDGSRADAAGNDAPRAGRRRGPREDPRRAEARRRAKLYRHYTIQEVIKRNQLVLVQARKEARGSKGAVFTTYISLPGRYTVLLPNTPHGRGMSRKIDTLADRKRLRKIIADIDVPEGMSTILRTAGQGRTKAEIRRDLDYLIRLWTEIRERTLKAVGPTLVHEENDIVKRAIRDLYQSDVEEVVVAGEEAYQAAKDFVKMLTPSKARHVKEYRDPEPFFHRYGMEDALAALHEPSVPLPSGGSIVFAQTEALVTVDVNSGRAIRERHIEETALKTNIEAADEMARQFRLRDLAGLIVIDFIGMEERRNNEAVERRLREALRGDRARTQVGRMSEFGLLEMSRQRLRLSVLDSRYQTCPTCDGSGWAYRPDAHALMVLRALEGEAMNRRGRRLEVRVPAPSAAHLANRMRRTLVDLEDRLEVEIDVIATGDAPAGGYAIEAVSREAGAGEPDRARRRAGADAAGRAGRRGGRGRYPADGADDGEPPAAARPRRGAGPGRSRAAASSEGGGRRTEEPDANGTRRTRTRRGGRRRAGAPEAADPFAAGAPDNGPPAADPGAFPDDEPPPAGDPGRSRAASPERDGRHAGEEPDANGTRRTRTRRGGRRRADTAEAADPFAAGAPDAGPPLPPDPGMLPPADEPPPEAGPERPKRSGWWSRNSGDGA